MVTYFGGRPRLGIATPALSATVRSKPACLRAANSSGPFGQGARRFQRLSGLCIPIAVFLDRLHASNSPQDWGD